jgi:hypothetical protein
MMATNCQLVQRPRFFERLAATPSGQSRARSLFAEPWAVMTTSTRPRHPRVEGGFQSLGSGLRYRRSLAILQIEVARMRISPGAGVGR